MITKSEGAEDNCPSCKQILVCRDIEYQGKHKLQWQYKDREVAHFSFDFKTGKTSCKEKEPSSTTPNVLTAPEFTKTDHIKLDKTQVEEIVKTAKDGTERLILVLSAVEKACAEAGITHPAKIGMIFNQVCENRR